MSRPDDLPPEDEPEFRREGVVVVVGVGVRGVHSRAAAEAGGSRRGGRTGGHGFSVFIQAKGLTGGLRPALPSAGSP